jgi:UTP--glucose-1-phosphate uridylyltransferase
MPVRKAVIPAAGLGTRFLPATKALPKEMLPIVDKPVIQYIIEDAVAAGIDHVVVVTAASKRAIEDHFDVSFELEQRLAAAGKQEELQQIRRLAELAAFSYVRQGEPKGNGHAVLCARAAVGNEPFAMIYGDDMVIADVPCVQQMIDVYDRYGGAVAAVMPVPERDVRGDRPGASGGSRVSRERSNREASGGPRPFQSRLGARLDPSPAHL